ncbi:MAG: DUF4416 domain-containing protein [Deltaproteobacteria bacterium]|nr:MAG: DUF4416 domain-containing protein [Deltaproteobacteria bacterium]
MSIPGRPLPVKPLVSVIYAQPTVAVNLLSELTAWFGPADLISPWLPFTQTSYYTAEMGPGLCRRLISFLHLSAPPALATGKLFTNRLEQRYALGGRRLVNIDPGYIARARLVLATGKNYVHRLYLDQGIYGDLTLVYQQGRFQPLPWTYPDYANPPLLDLLHLVRKKYLWQLRTLAKMQG